MDRIDFCPFFVGDVALAKSKLECKVCCSTSLCIALCHDQIIYVHYGSPKMLRACINLGMYEHHVSNDTCCESLDMAYQCVATEVMKTSTTKNSNIVMAANKHLLAKYLLKTSIKH